MTTVLDSGQIYAWRVISMSGQTETANFKVLPREDAALWGGAVGTFVGQPLLLGAFAEDLGLLALARNYYSQGLTADPDSTLAGRLLEGLESQ